MLPLTVPGAQHMDLNYLYERRGRSLLMAAQARCDSSRAAHLGLARGYVDQIDAFRFAGKADRAPGTRA